MALKLCITFLGQLVLTHIHCPFMKIALNLCIIAKCNKYAVGGRCELWSLIPGWAQGQEPTCTLHSGLARGHRKIMKKPNISAAIL